VNQVELIQLVAQPVATLRLPADPHELSEVVENRLTEVWAHLEDQGAGPAGPPLSILHHLTLDGEVPAPPPWEVESGFPLLEPVPEGPGIRVHELPAGEAASLLHVGDYAGLVDAYLLLQSWVLANERESAAPPWEVYLTDPGQEPDPDAWQTQVIWPLRGS